MKTMQELNPRLETPRLVLRPVDAGDIPQMQKLFAEWEIVKYLNNSVPWPYPEDGARQFIEAEILPGHASGREYVFAIVEKEDAAGRLIGTIALHAAEDGRFIRGFWLGLPYHGRGYMTEAVGAFNDFVFDVLGVPVLRADAYKGNDASQNVKQKTAARYLGTEQAKPCVCGETERHIWEVRAEDWRAFRAAEQARG